MRVKQEIIGKYKLIKEIGSGGFGSVYLVEKNGSQFALKKLSPAMATPEVSERFIREALKVEELRKNYQLDYLVRIEEVLFDHLAFVMEYIPQSSTQYFSTKKDMKFIDLFIQAIYQLHQIGVVHRDLKPSNLRVLNSRPVLIDFGIASWWDGNSNIMPAGTKYYSPPEIVCLFDEYKKLKAAREANMQLIEIMPDNAKERIKYIKKLHDIYGLGITIGELLTGSIPLNRESYIDYLKNGDDPVYRAWLNKIPEKYRDFVTKATTFSPVDRPQLENLFESLRIELPGKIIEDYDSREEAYFSETDFECLSCGRKTAPPANFCPYCGVDLDILVLNIYPGQEILTGRLPGSIKLFENPESETHPLTIAFSLSGEDFEVLIGRSMEGVQLAFVDDNWMSNFHGRFIKEGKTVFYIDGVENRLPTNPGRINNIPVGNSRIELLSGAFLLLGSTIFKIRKYFGDISSVGKVKAATGGEGS
ncbi:MAG: protein kinase [Candidatus Aminicenantes bacterium]|nr:protein kinase [Candidatus Aminicenantes bacterium]